MTSLASGTADERFRSRLERVEFPSSWLPAALAAADKESRGNAIVGYQRFLRARGRSVDTATMADVTAFFGVSVVGRAWASSTMTGLRRLYRSAVAMGLTDMNPVAEMPIRKPTKRLDRVLTADEVQRVVAVVRVDLGNHRTALAASRNLLLIGLGLWLGLPAKACSALTWGQLISEDSELDLASADQAPSGDAIAVPAPIRKLIVDWRNTLRSEGVEPIAEEPLFASTHPQIRLAWAQPQRELLVPMKSGTIGEVIRDYYLAAGIVPRRERGQPIRYTNLVWLRRETTAEVEAALAGPTAARRVPTVKQIWTSKPGVPSDRVLENHERECGLAGR